MNFEEKYLKYKNKYLNSKNGLNGGANAECQHADSKLINTVKKGNCCSYKEIRACNNCDFWEFTGNSGVDTNYCCFDVISYSSSSKFGNQDFVVKQCKDCQRRVTEQNGGANAGCQHMNSDVVRTVEHGKCCSYTDIRSCRDCQHWEFTGNRGTDTSKCCFQVVSYSYSSKFGDQDFQIEECNDCKRRRRQ